MTEPKPAVLIPVSTALAMIRARKENNDDEFETQALILARTLISMGEEELAHYIWAQFGLVHTWVPQ